MIPDAQTNNISFANSTVFPYRSDHIPVTFVCILYSCLEKLIRKEVQRAHKDHSGIVACLKASNQQCVCADSMGELHTHWAIHLYILWSGGLKQFFHVTASNFCQDNFVATRDMFCHNKHVLWQNYCRHKNDTGGSSCQWQWSPSWRTTLNCKVRASPFWQPSLDSALKVNSSAMTISQLASSAIVFPRCTIRTASDNMQNNQVLPPAEHVWYYWNEANQV